MVTLTDLEAWSYALHGKLTIIDPANTVIKGARVSIYRAVIGSGETTTDEDGHTIYPAGNYEGKNALLRKTYAGTQEFAMSTLPPNTDIYVQYTYRYNAQVDTGNADENGNPIKVVTRKTVASDIIKLTTPTNEGIAPVEATWSECFAALDKDIQLDALTLRNTTDYDAEAEAFDYENFKKNTLAYVNRLEFTLTPVGGGDAVVLSTGSNVLRAAKEGSGTVFASSGGKLQPSTQYTYTVRAVDRYGNSMPLIANGSYSFSGTLYTRKTAPVVKIEEVSNVTDKLTLKVTVNDPYATLLPGEALKLTVVDGSGIEADLYGSWENGDKFGDATSSSSKTVLELAEPTHDKSYTFTLDSLAFARAYTIRVTGNYDPQPTGVTAPRLDVVTDAVLGTARSYTASLSTGSIQFSAFTSEISDTYATLGFTMNKSTTLDILSIVDAFKLTISDTQNNAVLTSTLTLDKLDTMDYEYNSERGSVVLQEADAATHTPCIELVGDESQFSNMTLWQALLLQAYVDENGEMIYTMPAQLRVSMTEGTLKTSTTYQMTMESLVYKSGIEYQVATSLTTNQFRTKKIQPKLQYEDFFIGGDVAQFIGLRIFDKDETIQQDGLVYVDLYYGETLLSTQKVYATSDLESETINLAFQNIIPDAEYTIVFRAAAYNDGGGFSANKQLWVFEDFLGGSGLNGKLTLEGLEYSSTRSGGNILVNFTGEEVKQKIESGVWTSNSSERVTTEAISLPEEANFVRVDGLSGSYNYIYFYNESGGRIQWYNGTDIHRPTSGSILTGVPKGAATMRILLSNPGSIGTRGIQASYYTTPQVNLVSEANALIQVQPGDLLCFSPNAASVSLYNEAKKPIGSVSRPMSSAFVVPDYAGYVSVGAADCGVYKVASAELEQGYAAEVSVAVKDSDGYLAKLSDTPQATVSVYKSDSVVNPVYADEPILTQIMYLDEREDGAWTAEMVQLLDRLEASCSYKMVLTAEYRGSMVELDTITFRTDGVYFTISNQDELQAVNLNPYANYIVVDDFAVTKSMAVSLHGTIDFQGHVITNEYMDGPMFQFVYQGAEIRNLVVDYPENASIKAPLFSDNRGLIEDIIIRTNGTHTTCTAASLLLQVNHGTVRNFIMRLGGDLYLSRPMGESIGLLVLNNAFGSLVENGYIYGANGAGIVFEKGEGSYSGGIFVGQTQYGAIRNVFTRMDIWFPTEENSSGGYSMGLSRSVFNEINNIYHVGDYYLLGSDGQKSLGYRLEKERFFHLDNNRTMENLWHVSQYIYDDNQANKVSPAAPAILYDAAWQQQALGNGFDVENCVPMGFYPRLNLSDCMQKYQEYLPLPVLYDNVPRLVGDSMADGFVQGNEAGAVLLRFQNERALPIRSITIDGLEVNQIHSQGKAEDGLWDVVIDVTALEFRSAYKVVGFTYLNGAAVQSVPNAEYTTTGVEFWKEVDSLTDWQEINDHMDWNYRITADLDFASDTLLQGAVMLNGSKTDMTKTVSFAGKLDGGYHENGQQKLHSIKGLKLMDTLYPYVIYKMAPGAVLSNLVIEDMTLTASYRTAAQYSGFVASADYARIENVHIRDSELRGVGSMGAILGESQYSLEMWECSVADSTISDAGTNATVYAGGLVGKPSFSNIKNCYVRNIELSIQNSSTVGGVGGLMGYNGYNALRDSYATGVIRATASQVGGIFGSADSNSQVTTCWSDMDIFVTGDYVGGIGGRFGNSMDSFLLSVGNISASGENAGRLFGTSGFVSANRIGYAFDEQTITGLEIGDTGDVTGLLTSGQLSQRSTWTDMIRMGSGFEYGSLSGGCFPKVLNDAGQLVWGQEDIPIPGLGGNHFITIQNAEYSDVAGKYYVIGQWNHPGYTTEQFVAALKKGVSTKELSVVLDGLGLTDEYIFSGRASIELTESSEGVSNLSITCSDLTKALETYTLTMKYGGFSVQADVDFGAPLYHEVPNLTVWNELMKNGHGTTGENFRITGKIDFERADTSYKSLKLGRLEGVQRTSVEPCFCNMEYGGGYNGEPWIESVSGGISNLRFENINADFSDVISAAKRSNTGLILSASTVANCDFKNIHLGCNDYSADCIGLFSTVNGSISDVTMEEMSLTKTAGTAISSYGGALAGYIHGGISNLTANDITVSLPTTNYVGGIVGYSSRTVGNPVKNMSLRTIYVEGRQFVGGFASRNYQLVRDCSLIGFTVKGFSAVGGFEEYHQSDVVGLTVRNGSVTTTSESSSTVNGYTGGAFGCVLEWYDVKDVLVQDVDVMGSQFSGGFIGKCDCRIARNIQVLGCTVTSNGDFINAGAGGLFGQRTITYSDTSAYMFDSVTVRATDVKAVFAAGGVGGKAATAAVSRGYIAEDVTVTATGSSVLTTGKRIDGCAGGVFGEVQYPLIRSVACGAQVTGARNVGGLIGELDWSTTQNAEITNSYYVGTVTATQDVAAGVIGYVDAVGVNLTTNHVNGVLVAGTITTPGEAFLLTKQRTGLIPDGKIGVWDNTVLNGQTLLTIAGTSGQTGISKTTLPENGKLLTAAKFNDWGTYEDMGFSTTDVELEKDGPYMPFVYNSGKKILPNTMEYDGESTGILKPLNGGNPDATVVYASGVDTVNIECAVGTTSININGTQYEPDANGVVTLTYDFNTGFTVGDASYSAGDLARTVMTYGDYWYYIEEGNVCYGSGKQETEMPTVSGIGEAVHLWRGKVICTDGSVYSLEGGTAAKSGESVTGLSKLDAARPFWSYSINGIQVDVYHDFTLYANERIDYRMFEMGGKLYSVSPYQNMVYDGVMLSTYNDGINAAERYFALLGQDGALVNYLTAWKAQSFSTTNIKHISNNLGYNKQIVLARYRDGSVAGYDYSKGEVLFGGTPAGTNFLAYASSQLRGLLGSFFGPGDSVITDNSFLFSEELIGEAAVTIPDGADVPGAATGDGIGQTGDFIGDCGNDVGDDAGISNENGIASDAAGGAAANNGTAEVGLGDSDSSSNAGVDSNKGNTANTIKNGLGQTGSFIGNIGNAIDDVDGTSNTNGTASDGLGDAAADSDVAEDGPDDEDASSNAEGGSDDGDASDAEEGGSSNGHMSNGEDGSAGNDESGSGRNDASADQSNDSGSDGHGDEGSTEANGLGSLGTSRGTYYVPGRGVVKNGIVALAESALSYIPGKGVYAEDKLLYAESLTPDEDLSQAVASQQAVELVTPEEHREQVLATMAKMTVAYDPVAETYTAKSGEEMLDSVAVSAGSDDYVPEEQVEDAVSEHGGSDLEISKGLGRALTDGEQSGFKLFAVLITVACVILILIYLRIVRKRR